MKEEDFIEKYIDEMMTRGLNFSRYEARIWAEESYENNPDETDIPYAVSEDISAAID